MEEPYEKELYNIFKSVENVKNDELDQKGVNALCETLHLDFGQRKQLWSFLDHNSTVSFEKFRDALIYLANSGIKEENYSRDISPGKSTVFCLHFTIFFHCYLTTNHLSIKFYNIYTKTFLSKYIFL